MRTAASLIILLALLSPACTPDPVQDGRVAELEATIEALQTTPNGVADLQRVRFVKALDGDSGIATDGNGEFEFRLYGIDAPERDDVSREALEALIARFGSNLYADDRDVDTYGRRVVVFQTADGTQSVNVEMVRQGYAYAYLDYGELDGVVAAESEAQANRRGVWAPPARPTWDEYWIEQDRLGNHHETYMQFLAASPTYANANSDYREFLESL